MTGSELAERAGVSRQVIVQDISLLKAKNEPVIATSEGYIFLHSTKNDTLFEKVIVCSHTPEQTKLELFAIVDHGVTVKDVKIEHPIYGDLSASVMVSNRNEVEYFLNKVADTNAPLLSQLTEGIHLHTLQADSLDKIEGACHMLEQIGILVKA
ncbi:transcription repressor NadR [Bacillus sp. RD4P76]|uniref:Transcription repressor NadR n=2 Tax=Bacillus suaedaesalsae TaxID=2810349 RepID=A0ABS2DML8_9BACI|nr:transcription repressor NadR [Bacillus suaedaesalsae]